SQVLHNAHCTEALGRVREGRAWPVRPEHTGVWFIPVDAVLAEAVRDAAGISPPGADLGRYGRSPASHPERGLARDRIAGQHESRHGAVRRALHTQGLALLPAGLDAPAVVALAHEHRRRLPFGVVGEPRVELAVLPAHRERLALHEPDAEERYDVIG